MFECEIEAIQKAFKAAKQISQDSQNSGGPLCKRVTICVDNLEAKNLIEVAIREEQGSLALESLLTNNARVRLMIHNIRSYVRDYTSVELRWIRSHTTSHSFLARGNSEADRLAKLGLEKAFAQIEEFHAGNYKRRRDIQTTILTFSLS